MGRLKKKAVILSVIGGLCGVFICFTVSQFSSGDGSENVSMGTEVLYYIVSFLHGAICCGTTVIYEFESWSILRATLTHFFITLISFYCLGFIQKWLVFGSALFFIVTAAFIVCYFIIWIVNYLSYRRVVKRMNEDIEKLKTEGNSENENSEKKCF